MTANIITGVRVLCSIVLLFCTALSPAFYAWYIMAGASDVLDGWIARRTNSASDLGAKLDTAADCFFVVACLIKLLPTLAIPLWIYLWTGPLIELKYSATFVCLLATFAALEEGHIIRTKKTIKKWKDHPRYHRY